MKPKQLQIAVPEPCHEDWNKMTPKDQGAFCGSCSKVVVDFTKMTDRELIAYFEKKKDEKTCGRFTKFQVDRTMLVHEPTPPFYLRLKNWMYGLLFSLSLPSFLKAENLLTKVNPIHLGDQDVIAFPKQIKGKIVDENGEGLPFAEVAVFQNGASVNLVTSSDFDGFFNLNLEGLDSFLDLELRVSSFGYSMKTIQLEAKENYEIRLLQNRIIVKGEVVEVKENNTNLHNNVTVSDVMSLIETTEEEALNSSTPNKISGKVVDQNGELLPFVSLYLLDNETITTSDYEGYFELDIPKNLNGKTKLGLEVLFMENSSLEIIDLFPVEKRDSILIKVEEPPLIMGQMMVVGLVVPQHSNRLKTPPDIDAKWRREGYSSKKEYREFKKGSK